MSFYSAILITSALVLIGGCSPQQAKPVLKCEPSASEVRKTPTEQELAQYRKFRAEYGDVK